MNFVQHVVFEKLLYRIADIEPSLAVGFVLWQTQLAEKGLAESEADEKRFVEMLGLKPLFEEFKQRLAEELIRLQKEERN